MMSVTPSRQRLAFAWLLATALLFAQALGQAHQVLHAPGVASDDALFGHHGSAECRLFDQLAHGDALATPALPALPDWPAAAPVAALHAGVEHGCTAVYRARGPPRG